MDTEHHSRQAFLGEEFPTTCKNSIIGIIGLGGGGSHIVQQLAHIGFENFIVFDPDLVEETNLNRLVGAYQSDIYEKTPKIDVAKRVILNINPDANVKSYQQKWQENFSVLEECDFIFGCLDGLTDRDQLEQYARRFLIPYIDIGVDIVTIDPQPPQMGGQIFISMPGNSCMRCVGLLDKTNLKAEGERYGDTGPRAQVVWANGVLASTAVGMAIQILTGWQGIEKIVPFLSFNGNLGTLTPDVRWVNLDSKECNHFPLKNIGPIVF